MIEHLIQYKELISITFGVTFILCLAVGFWKYHQIQEDQDANESPGVTKHHQQTKSSPKVSAEPRR